MKNIHFIGDVHGKFERYFGVIQSLPEKSISIQLGDFGLGFHPEIDQEYLSVNIGKNHKWIYGNHDNPRFRTNENCLGDYGIFQDIFYVSGAWSVDQWHRTIGRSWWPEEEQSVSSLENMLKFYSLVKPDFVCSHDSPFEVKKILIGEEPKDRTSNYLQMMLDIHRPKTWIFGHFHITFNQTIKKTNFIGLGELEVLSI
jgi:hypothetical protein